MKQILVISIYCIFSHFIGAADSSFDSFEHLGCLYEYFKRPLPSNHPLSTNIKEILATVPLYDYELGAFVSGEETFNFLEIIKKEHKERDDIVDYSWRSQFTQKAKYAAIEFVSELGFSPAENIPGYDVCRRNPKKNRYRIMAPLDDSRVKLRKNDEKNPDNYINASLIRSSALIPGVVLPDFIITQAPQQQNKNSDETIEDFWRMVWEQNIRLIVMLTDFNEDNFNKADPYYPLTDKDIADVYGTFFVCNHKQQVIGDIVISELSLTKKGEMRKIIHLHYKKWLDHSCPPSALAQLKLIDYCMHFHLSAPESPALVHCSAGIGRSGAFVIVYAAIKQIMTTGTEPDIKQMVLNLRECRAYNMVKYPGQYEKIFLIIEDFLNRKCTKS